MMATAETVELTASYTLDLFLKEIHRLGINRQSPDYEIVCAAIRNLRDRLGDSRMEKKGDSRFSENFPDNMISSETLETINDNLIEAEVGGEEKKSCVVSRSSNDESIKAQVLDTTSAEVEGGILKTEDVVIEGVFATKDEVLSEEENERTIVGNNETTVGLSNLNTSSLPTRRSSRRFKRPIKFEYYEMPASVFLTVTNGEGSSQDQNPRENQRDLNEHGVLHREETPESPAHVQDGTETEGEVMGLGNKRKSRLGRPGIDFYSCSACGQVSQGMSEADRHLQEYHPYRKLVHCLVCSANLSSNKSLYRHTQMLHGNGRYDCPICGISFKAKYGLTQHSLRVHCERTFPCSEDGCRKVFKTKQTRDKHVLTHMRPIYKRLKSRSENRLTSDV